MKKNEIWEIEEEHNRNNRLLDEAEETLSDYRKQMQQKTDDLSEYIFRVYSDIEQNDAYHYIRQLEESAEEFNWEIRQKQRELEETRDEKRREFNRKLDL